MYGSAKLLSLRFKELASFCYRRILCDSSPLTLAICRIGVYGFFLWFFWDVDFETFAPFAPRFWHPIQPFRHIFLRPTVFSTALLKTLHHSWEVALLLSCLGFLTRISTLLSFILAAVLVGYSNSIVRPYHTENLMILVFFWLAFSHCGDALSIDRWIDRRLFSGNMIERKIRARSLKGEYSWPIWFARIQMTLIICSAGMSKLRASGLDWVLSGHLSNLMIARHFLPERALPLEKLPLWLSQYKWAMKALAGTTVLFEISAPLALVSTRARAIIIPGAFAMMSGFWALMGIPFPGLLICWLFWLPLDAGWLARFIPISNSRPGFVRDP